MGLILLVLALVLGIVVFQVAQGLFSATIMTILAVLCTLLAFNYYERLAEYLYGCHPLYADAISLVALLVIPLITLRLVFDTFIRSNIQLGVWADRIGGGLLGLITAMTLVGVVTIAAQMLPFGETILTYSSHTDSLERDQHLWPFRPDEFTLAMVNTLSKAGIGGGRPFESVHDDLLLESFCSRNTAGIHAG